MSGSEQNPGDFMENLVVDLIHQGHRNEILNAISVQAKELEGVEFSVTCPCGTAVGWQDAFRCFYCEVFLCRSCAETHFKEGTNSGQDGGSP